MYNEKIKTEFLTTIDDVRYQNNLRSLFKKTESIEEIFGKDLCEFTHSDMSYLFEISRYTIGNTFYTYKTNIRKYIVWCVEQHYCDSNAISEIERLKYEELGGDFKMKVEYFSSLDDLIDTIVTVCKLNNIDSSVYNRITAYYCLYWLKLKKEEIFHIKKSDVDIENKTIKIGNKCIDVPDILMPYIKYVYYSEDFITDKNFKIRDGEYFFRTTRNPGPITDSWITHFNWANLVTNIDVSHKYYGKVLKADAILKCSIFYDIKQNIEEEGIDLTEENVKPYFNLEYKNIGKLKLFIDEYRLWRKHNS